MPRSRVGIGWMLVGMLALSTPVSSQSRPDRASVQVGGSGGYKGVCPGTVHTPPVARAVRGNAITWPGFQMLPDGGSRIFVQSTAPVAQRVERTAGALIVHLGAASLAHDNNARPLVTHFFNTPVERAWIRIRKARAALVMEMRAGAKPSLQAVVQKETGLHFLYVDFAPGQYFDTPSVARRPGPADVPDPSARPTHLQDPVSPSAAPAKAPQPPRPQQARSTKRLNSKATQAGGAPASP